MKPDQSLGDKSFRKEPIPVGKIFGNKTRKITSNLMEEFMDSRRPDSLSCEFDPSDRNKVLELLAQQSKVILRLLVFRSET